ncbi:alpha-1,3-mannosyl-glycoproteinbeta-1,2-N-acetylglucosaminyltransferase isoform 1 [Galdieria sulphuraria]|uniref:alpha-1,3-mannosyl-glycoprotein 2-beta-N-acetylglucosaminyltransferase n=1 Tax=Galdieria sulphuraria TaxID=130081 RepID=M2X8H1_GALSU|nr:alpha-1,3-mannosyl-glycoproteinbeta-1,2-N-acetylglucosaminyltransferase isoform 1 [Galdieria sulphuraria]EME32850.1 alpha-1,3-mannosyl-glycoproteinbeta-1,2-N-acetylglucosaminyltransferase isoform 1 [Galdieria sulphuraria]|eukprot:XP_005709370.1 alpha-1,3-mannosyl-glycoproteinbeta-1,2-N-acetylglucosaminyltransferase isoform 1 [Galdieria sulphuraria]
MNNKLLQHIIILSLTWNNMFYYCSSLLSDLNLLRNNKAYSIVLITNCQRDSISLTLQSLYRLPQIEYFSVFISMDCNQTNKNIQNWIEQKYQKIARGILYFPRHRYPKVSRNNSYSQISCHLHFAIQQVFEVHNYSSLVVIEDDLLFAEDFLLLFLETYPLLMTDKSLLCVSAYHDLGLKQFSWKHNRLKRVQGFTGLGWMLSRDKWLKELSYIWPLYPFSGWDHWLRMYQRIHHLDCIVPEVSRSIHQKVSGSHLSHKEWQRRFSHLLFYDNESVDTFGNLDYLQREVYDREIQMLLTCASKLHSLSSNILKQSGENIQIIIPCTLPKGNRYWRHWFRFLEIPLSQEIESFYEGILLFPMGFQTILFICTNSPFYETKRLSTNFGSYYIIRSHENASCSEACDKVFLGKYRCQSETLAQIDSFAIINTYFDCSKGFQLVTRSWAPGCLFPDDRHQAAVECVCVMHNQWAIGYHPYSCDQKAPRLRRLYFFQALSKDLVEDERKFMASSSVALRQKLLEELLREALESSGKTLEEQETLVKIKLRDRGLKLQENQQRQQSKSSKRKKQTHLTAKELRGNHLFAIPKKEQCFQAFIPLHWLWLGYARKVLSNSGILSARENCDRSQLHSHSGIEWLYRMDLHGAILTVIRSKAPQQVGNWGIVLQETSNVFKLIRPDNTVVAVPKEISDWGCRIDEFCFVLHGKAYRMKSSERSVKKLKRKISD